MRWWDLSGPEALIKAADEVYFRSTGKLIDPYGNIFDRNVVLLEDHLSQDGVRDVRDFLRWAEVPPTKMAPEALKWRLLFFYWAVEIDLRRHLHIERNK